MPKSKKPRKKRKPQLPKSRVINKYPHCKICGSETRLANDSELATMRAHDPSFNQDFLFIPTCDCWETHDEWMVL